MALRSALMATDRPATLPEMATEVAAQLSACRSMSETDLIVALQAAGLDLTDDPADRFLDLLDTELVPLFPVGDDRWALMPSLLADRVFTHRVTPIELEHDALLVTPDLLAMTVLLDDERYQHLADGTELEESVSPVEGDNGDALYLPPGHLQALGLSAGDLVGLRVAADGLHLDPVAASDLGPVPPGWVTCVVAAVDERPEDPALVEEVVWRLCADDDALFATPLPPIAELLDRPELTTERGRVARHGFDFARHRTDQSIQRLQRLHDLDRDEATAVLALVRLVDQVESAVDIARSALSASDDPAAALTDVVGPATAVGRATERADASASSSDRTVRDALPMLAEPAVAEALLTEVLGTERDRAPTLALFAESLEAQAPARARPSLRWLRAKAKERLGAIAEAEADLRAALAMDLAGPLALMDLARYASDRGDAEQGLSLLRRAGVRPDDALVELLERYRPTSRTDLGRNDRCWCGSGRKYKQCHLGHETLPLEERATWLYAKARMYLDDGPWRMQLLALAYVRSEHWPDEAGAFAALEDPLAADAVLFEGGAFAAFLEERGALLPEDERLLAEQWLLVERSVHEVQDVQPGRSVTLRDVRTGDVHEIPERTASRTLSIGDLICARVVPAGEVMAFFGGLEPISVGERAAIIELLDGEPDPAELVTRLSARFAPPTLSNTEGDPLVFCEVDARVPDPARLAIGLDRAYDRQAGFAEDDSHETVWVEHVTTMGLERIRATVGLTGDHLRISVNSEERLDRVLAVLRELEPDLEVLDIERTTVTDLGEAMARRPPGRPEPTSLLDSDDPEVAAVIEQVVRQHEAAWVDESIPALGGVTPREAAADPTRRDDLERLLRSFEGDAGHPGAMDVRRIRAALGL